MTKSNFVVSANKEAWISDARRLFAADPYIAHVLERDGQYSQYEDIQVAQPPRATRDDFQQDHVYVDRKFARYTAVLVRRLDELHRTAYGTAFWEKALSLAILRHVNYCYELFKVCEVNLNPMIHNCRILDPSSYSIPVDFDEHRDFFQNTGFGQEQLFSIYCGIFYPGQFETWHSDTVLNYATAGSGLPRRRLWRKYTLAGVAGWLFRIPEKILHWLLHIRAPRLGVLNAYFSPEHRSRLLTGSRGRIQTITLPEIPSSTSALQWDKRDRLARDEPDFDRFDRFVFACLRYSMPKTFIEDFQDVYTRLNDYFDQYCSLRWVVSEAWIGHMLPSLALAILQQRGVRHIYNEHNYLAHPFMGNNLKYITPLVDEFVSLGWNDPSIKNLICGASLFNWIEGAESRKENELLFISSIPNTHAPEINASYGESGASVVPGYLEMNCKFFEAMKEATLNTMVYRGYPAKIAEKTLAWDQAFVLGKYLSKVKLLDDTSGSARLLMQRSRLVVINYLSTSYLEALLSDVPTIILWNKEAYLLEDKYSGFFDGLIDARICHADPVGAAHFVEQIKDNPEVWWQSPVVRHAREEFLGKNIGPPEVLADHLIDRAFEPDAIAARQV